MSKVQLLATFIGSRATTDKRGRPRVRGAISYVRFRRESPRIECSCGCVLVYSPTEHDVDNLRVLNQVCSHIVALYVGDFSLGGTVTALGREMFTWCWAQSALERST